VIIGQRRVGKSYMLYQLIDYIEKKVKNPLIIYINKELHEFDEIKNSNDLVRYVNSVRKNRKKDIFLFIDEIQDITDFEKALRSFHAENIYDIYCTGSNAAMFSGELATFLSGRYVEIKIYGLSYTEFLLFHSLEDSNDSLQSYIKYGGLPFLINLELNELTVYEYLRNICNTILLKDIVSRHNIRNIDFLERLVEFVAENIGSMVSSKKISDYLKSQKINISPNIVLDYLSYLTSAFFIFKTKRTDITGKKIFEIGEKYYFEDLGIRHTISGFTQQDIHKVLENLVYLHMKINGYDVYVGEIDGREIDFVCRRSSVKIYIQVSYMISGEDVHKREFGNLLKIDDNYRKIVVSMDEISGGGYEGIEHIHIRKFLNSSI
jgi:predicted AAA+ superfamily ATPase